MCVIARFLSQPHNRILGSRCSGVEPGLLFCRPVRSVAVAQVASFRACMRCGRPDQSTPHQLVHHPFPLVRICSGNREDTMTLDFVQVRAICCRCRTSSAPLSLANRWLMCLRRAQVISRHGDRTPLGYITWDDRIPWSCGDPTPTGTVAASTCWLVGWLGWLDG